MVGARPMSTAEQERRKRQRAGTPIPGDLAALERAKDAKMERIRESRTMLPEQKRLEGNEVKREFVANWRRMRAEISDGFEERRKPLQRQANPPVDDATLGRMSTMSAIYSSKWRRAPGNLVADSIVFEQQDDVAGLLLAKENAGLLAPGQRTELVQLVDSVLSDHQTADQKKALAELKSLDAEKQAFEIGAAARPIAKLNAEIKAEAPTRAPAPDMPAPQR